MCFIGAYCEYKARTNLTTIKKSCKKVAAVYI